MQEKPFLSYLLLATSPIASERITDRSSSTPRWNSRISSKLRAGRLAPYVLCCVLSGTIVWLLMSTMDHRPQKFIFHGLIQSPDDAEAVFADWILSADCSEFRFRPEDQSIKAERFGSTWFFRVHDKRVAPAHEYLYVWEHNREILPLTPYLAANLLAAMFPDSNDESDHRKLIAKAIELLSPYSEMISGVSEIPKYSDEQLLANGESSLLDEDMESVIRPLWRKEGVDKLVYVCFARSQTTGIIQRYRFQFDRSDPGWSIQFVQQGDVSPETGETYGLEYDLRVCTFLCAWPPLPRRRQNKTAIAISTTVDHPRISDPEISSGTGRILRRRSVL